VELRAVGFRGGHRGGSRAALFAPVADVVRADGSAAWRGVGLRRGKARRSEAGMAHLNLEKLRQAKLETDPYLFTIVPGFLSPECVRQINATYPKIVKGGSYPIESLEANMTIKEVIDELDGPEFERMIEEKFGVSLAGRPKMYSLRGYTRAKDGQIHTDSKDKIITVHDVDDYVAEVPPDNGTLLVFKRSDNSWHGHPPFEGQRRSLQMNWMTSEGAMGFHKLRHTLSAAVKKLAAAG
jgi:SM-20-related protein